MIFMYQKVHCHERVVVFQINFSFDCDQGDQGETQVQNQKKSTEPPDFDLSLQMFAMLNG